MEDPHLQQVRKVEYAEWMSKLTAIVNRREELLKPLKVKSHGCVSPDVAFAEWARPIRLASLREMAETRLSLREEYGKRHPPLLSDASLSALCSDLVGFIERSASSDPRSIPKAGDITAAVRVAIDKLALYRPDESPALARVAAGEEGPMVFISYSWDSLEHKEWAFRFATQLRADGIDARLDEIHCELGERTPQFMEKSVRDSSKVLVICTNRYKEKFDGRLDGVGYEGHIISAEMVSTQGKNKFIPVMRHGDWHTAMPTALSGIRGVDLRNDSAAEYTKLLNHLLGIKSVPPIGPASAMVNDDADQVEVMKAKYTEWLGDILRLPPADLPLIREKRGGGLVIWLQNDTLDPLPECSISLQSVQRYSARHKDFERNPFTPVVLLNLRSIPAGSASSEAATLACCARTSTGQALTFGGTDLKFSEAGTWKASLLIEADGRRRKDELFVQWNVSFQQACVKLFVDNC